jgi:hypothetical protein
MWDRRRSAAPRRNHSDPVNRVERPGYRRIANAFLMSAHGVTAGEGRLSNPETQCSPRYTWGSVVDVCNRAFDVARAICRLRRSKVW